MVQRGVKMVIVRVVVLALYGIHGNLFVHHQRSGHIILGGQRIRGAKDDIGATGGQGLHQVGRLCGNVQAGGEAQPGERCFAFESLADQPGHRHFLGGPFNTVSPFVGEGQVFHIIVAC